MNNKMILNIIIVYFILLSIVLAVQLYNMKKRGPVASPSSSGDVLIEDRLNDTVVFCEDSAVMLVNKKQMVIDTADCSNVPYVSNKLVYVPVSLFRQAYNATVSSDTARHTATIRMENEALVVTENSAQVVDNSGERNIDGYKSAVQVTNGCVYVPVELFADAFGKAVDYYDNMVIISKSEDTFKEDEKTEFLTNLRSQVTSLPSVGTQSNLRELIGINGANQLLGLSSEKTSTVDLTEEYKQPSVLDDKECDADIIADYGDYIYYIDDKRLNVVHTAGSSMTLSSSVDFESDFTPYKLYLYGERLVVIGVKQAVVSQPYSDNDKFYPYSNICTGVYVYDLTDRSNISQIRYIEVQGDYQLSKRSGDMLTIGTNVNAVGLTDGEKWYTPYCSDKRGDNVNSFAPTLENVRYFPEMNDSSYTMLVSIDLADTVRDASVKCWLGAGKNIRLSDDSLFVAKKRVSYYGSNTVKTDNTFVYKFAATDGYNGIVGHSYMHGTPAGTEAIDFKDGFLRVATSGKAVKADKYVNNIYIINSNMEITGEVTGIASKSIPDVSFTENRVLLCEENDKSNIFVVDITDATQPSFMGEVKLSGYNGFIYPYADNRVITLGKMLVPGENGQADVMKDVKLSIYDISNISEPVEKYFTTIGDRGTDSQVFNDPRTFWYDEELGLIAFPLNLYVVKEDDKKDDKNADTPMGELGYIGEYFYSIDSDSLKYQGRISHISENVYGSNYKGDSTKVVRRVVRKGNYLYTVSDSRIVAFQPNDFEKQYILELNDVKK